jgi:uncharacterized protein (TIGR02284 family)
MFQASSRPQVTTSPQASASIFNALIRRGIDLRSLYRQAATACEPGLRMVLNENAQTLDLLIADLQTQLRSDGENVCVHGSLRGVAYRHVTGWLLHVTDRHDSAWIRALAHRENALLESFERAIAAVPAESALSLRRQLPRLRSIHLDMHSLAGTARY